ncbi:bifunctional phosphoribosyl-AMP cyclohydrolase/phosphoribosyl-ATP diphosphatase HisIE [Candidatus Bathyarchaeota archaeon]|nr:bifunctional phosphoribosyl-AMP cyclohydrolase/phosphoribosyl-ATP diphosphatase HisIE [Candidatus Bathyarchaeota archaeon]
MLMDRKAAEELAERVDFRKGGGLIPAVVQDASSGIVLMQAYMNREALLLTLLTGKTHFWSRSRKRIWMKGEESGHYSIVENLSLDCDGDAVLIKVQQIGPACHTNRMSCFHNPVLEEEEGGPTSTILEKVYETILERIRSGDERSYVKSLTSKGEEAILDKIREESEEVVQAARKSEASIISEVSDLLFHSMVYLASRRIAIEEVFKELEKRHREKTSLGSSAPR